jgi:hypothetical protein
MTQVTVNLTDTFEDWRVKTNQICANQGDIATLTTATQASLVAAINEIDATSGLGNLVEDTSPQLGGSLDVNGQSIVSVTNGNITITPDGTGSIILDGNVGIGTTAPVGQLHLASPVNTMLQLYLIKTSQVEAHIGFKSGTDQNLYIGTSGGTTGVGSYGLYQTNTGNTWNSVSDERLKTNLQPITNAREKIAGCRAVTGRFTYDEDESKSRAFLIAQDWVDALPEAVDQEDPDKLGLSYDATIPLLVASIKELIVEVDNLKQEVATLKGA